MVKKSSFSIFILSACALLIWGFSPGSDKDPRQKNLNAKKISQLNTNSKVLINTTDILEPGPKAQQSIISESFEGALFPPAGWSKLSPDGGTGWNQQMNGTTPVPGFGGGSITVPPGGGTKVAFCAWLTGGDPSSDQWLITPQITNVQVNDSLKFWLRYWPDSYRDSFQVFISTTTPTVPAFTITVLKKDFEVSGGDTNWTQYRFRLGNFVSAGANIYVGFREIVDDNFTEGSSFSLDLVSTTASVAFNNDIAANGNISPSGNVFLPSSTIAPKAIFANVGGLNQTSIPVRYSITGPVNYTSNKIISSLSSSATTTVIFDSTFIPTAGAYNVIIIASLGSDQNRSNDTLETAFVVTNSNFGGNGGYFFANSTATTAPSHPEYCWKDTSSSVSLCKNFINSQPGIFTGTLDDGYWKIALPSGKRIRFYGVNIDTVRIGTNGIIAFKEFDPGGINWNPPSGGIPGGTVTNAFYPLWNDFDLSDNTITASNRVSYKIVGNQFVVTYDRTPVYDGEPGEYVSFQVVIDLAAVPVSDSRILVQYADASDGKTGQTFIDVVTGNTLESHLVGLQNAAATNALTYRFRNASGSVVTPGPLFTPSEGSLAVQFGPNASLLNSKCQSMTMTFRLQAIQLTRRDTVSISIRQATSPHAIVETEKVVYDSITGSASATFSLAENGSSYYIYATHRNSIPTWSASPLLFTGFAASYNFTTNICQSFGCNQILVNTKASFYSGDVTLDGCVDVSDIVAIYNDAFNFVGGPYVLTDLNFDEFVDVTDLLMGYNNAVNFVCEVAPPAPRITGYAIPDYAILNYAKDETPAEIIIKERKTR